MSSAAHHYPIASLYPQQQASTYWRGVSQGGAGEESLEAELAHPSPERSLFEDGQMGVCSNAAPALVVGIGCRTHLHTEVADLNIDRAAQPGDESKTWLHIQVR
jgi:hypothetical protein